MINSSKQFIRRSSSSKKFSKNRKRNSVYADESHNERTERKERLGKKKIKSKEGRNPSGGSNSCIQKLDFKYIYVHVKVKKERTKRRNDMNEQA